MSDSMRESIRDEIARLTAERDHLARELARRDDEYDLCAEWLMAARKKCEQAEAARDAARAEVARLREALVSIEDQARIITERDADVRRLREALEEARESLRRGNQWEALGDIDAALAAKEAK